MKAYIYAYRVNNQTYYAEGYNESDIRSAVEKELNLEQGSLRRGRQPDFQSELRRIWNKKDKEYTLFLNKNQTSSEDKLKKIEEQKRALYELKLLLREDSRFLSGINEPVIVNLSIKVKKNPYFKFSMYNNTGHEMCYENPDGDVNDIYRFKKLTDAYWYVRRNLIDAGVQNDSYNRTELTNLEVCDSFIAGFGNPHGNIDINNKSDRSFPLSLQYKSTK